MWIDIFRHLRHAVRRKRPQKFRGNILFLFHYNGPAHLSVLVKDFLTTNNVTALQYPPYSPDLAEADFYLIPTE